MDLSIAAILAQDGITTGAIYALLALALVLVFSVTRVIFIPQGEFVSYGALTLAALQSQKFPATCWLLMAMGAACFVVETAGLVGHPERRALPLGADWGDARGEVPAIPGRGVRGDARTLRATFADALANRLDAADRDPDGTVRLPAGFEPIAEGTTLVLLIVAVAVHFAMVGLGLVMFGAEGSRTDASRMPRSTSAACRSPGRACG